MYIVLSFINILFYLTTNFAYIHSYIHSYVATDHYGNVTAQVEYSTLSERWNFPALYHQKSFQSADTDLSLDVIFIDTVDLSGSGVTSNEEDPRYYDKLAFRPKAAAATQWDWIEEQLKASTADYLIVAGHYPMYSVCQHGPTSNLINNLRPLLCTLHGRP